MGLRDCLIKADYTTIPYTTITIDRKGNINSDINIFINSNNEKAIISEFWLYKKEYTLAKIVALSFKPVNIPYDYWEYLYVDFIDNDKNNLEPTNLIWRFSKLLESKEHSGFYYIPGFTRSLISLDGQCINTYRNHILATDIVDGYITLRVYSDHKRDRTRTTIHRLLCLTFKGYPSNVDDLEINHIDGNKLNNSLDNLEWVTHARNMQHAKETDLITCNIPFLTRNVITGEIKEYYSTIDFENETGINRSIASKKLSYKGQPVFTDNLQYKRKDEESPWREVVDLEAERRRAGFVRPVLVKNIFTNEIKEFENASIAEIELGLLKTRLLFHHANRKDIPLHSFVFKDVTDNTPWPIFNKKLLDLFKVNVNLGRPHHIRIYKVTNNKTKEFDYFHNQDELNINGSKLNFTIEKTDITKETRYV